MNIFPDMCAHTKGFFIDGFFLTAEVEMFELNPRERERVEGGDGDIGGSKSTFPSVGVDVLIHCKMYITQKVLSIAKKQREIFSFFSVRILCF